MSSEILEIDSRGRITLPKHWREALQVGKVLAIRSETEVILIPVAKYPIAFLSGRLNLKKTIKQLKQEAEAVLLTEKR